MDQNAKQMPNISMEEAKKLAQSEAGQKLFTALQQSHGNQLKNAMDHVSNGDLQEAKKALSEMLNTPEVRAFLKQLGGSGNG